MFKIKREDINKIDFLLVIIIILGIIACIIFADKIYNPMIDVGREMYFPSRIINNEILYKDIFNIFAPFSYMFVAAIYKIFKQSLNTYFMIGNTASLILLSGIYFLSNLFLSKKVSFLICLFTIVSSIMIVTNFAWVHSYSFAIIFGFIFFTYSLLFYLKSFNLEDLNDKNNLIASSNDYLNNKQILLIYLAALFSGFATVTKYEMIPYSLFLICLITIRLFKNKRKMLFSLFLFLVPNLFLFAILFIQGLNFKELIIAIASVFDLVKTPGFHALYQKVGTIFSIANINIDIIRFGKIIFIIIPLSCALFFYNKYKTVSILLFICSCFAAILYCLTDVYKECFSYIFILTAILFIIRFKSLNFKTKILVFSILISSLKVLWYVNINYYGSYFIPFLILALISLIEQKHIKNAFIIFLIIYSSCIIYKKTEMLPKTAYPIISEAGTVYAGKQNYLRIRRTMVFIRKNTKNTDRIVIYPEGLFINYMTNRPSNDYYYALSPAYMQLWGEDNLIKYFSKNKNMPEYFIFTNEYIGMYGADYMCKDYAVKFCEFVFNNYKKVKVIKTGENDKHPYEIYKRKSKLERALLKEKKQNLN